MVFAQLFADAAADQTLAYGGWIGGVIGVLTLLANTWLSVRRMQFDGETMRLKLRIESLEAAAVKSEAECQRRIDAVQNEVKIFRAQLAAEQAKTARLEDRLIHESDRRRHHDSDLSARMDFYDGKPATPPDVEPQ